jgi:NhaA family Na+:H+ antiporter
VPVGGACLAGMGFTMALFLNALAGPAAEFPAYEAAGKIGTLAGSLVSLIVSAVVLSYALTPEPNRATSS